MSKVEKITVLIMIMASIFFMTISLYLLVYSQIELNTIEKEFFVLGPTFVSGYLMGYVIETIFKKT